MDSVWFCNCCSIFQLQIIIRIHLNCYERCDLVCILGNSKYGGSDCPSRRMDVSLCTKLTLVNQGGRGSEEGGQEEGGQVYTITIKEEGGQVYTITIKYDIFWPMVRPQ